ncbi:hypothetical protein HYX19_04790 [Candidatus Woesearchaeota archaeon]|nr:hypothetical protein [Candidatus Woesearchaeota archaeon]
MHDRIEPFKINLAVSILGYEEDLEKNKNSLNKSRHYRNLFEIAENCDYIHIDVIRDNFVKDINRFLSPLYLEVYGLLREKSEFEFHFMLNDQLPHINFMNFKIDRKEREKIRIILPIESNRKPEKPLEIITKKEHDLFQIAQNIAYAPLKKKILDIDNNAKKIVLENLIFIKQCGYKTGISIEPGTLLEGIQEEIWKATDYILFMGVSSGKGGQEYKKEVNKKISLFSDFISGYNISVDGGVNLELIPEIIKSGADSLVIGSCITNNEDVRNAISIVKKKIRDTIDEIMINQEKASKRIAYLANFS